MDNPFLGNPKHLSSRWRELRSILTSDKTDHQHLIDVVSFWSKAPMVNPYLNWDDTKSWPDPWELIASMDFDPSSVALGMEYTLLLGEDGRWTTDRLQLGLVRLIDGSQQYIVLNVDGNHILNHYLNTVVSMDECSKDFVIQQAYSYINKTHVNVEIDRFRWGFE
jgi:hypothetical protein